MAVEVKYVVIREGEEKMSFASKKEADAYDKMLDLAEVLGDWLGAGPVTLEDETRDQMALWLAEQKRRLAAFLSPANCTALRRKNLQRLRQRMMRVSRQTPSILKAQPNAQKLPDLALPVICTML